MSLIQVGIEINIRIYFGVSQTFISKNQPTFRALMVLVFENGFSTIIAIGSCFPEWVLFDFLKMRFNPSY